MKRGRSVELLTYYVTMTCNLARKAFDGTSYLVNFTPFGISSKFNVGGAEEDQTHLKTTTPDASPVNEITTKAR